MGDSGEKGENFEVVIFAIKGFLSMQNLTWSSIVLFSSFCVAYFGKKKKTFENFTYGHFDILPLDNMKVIFKLIDLKFGIFLHV